MTIATILAVLEGTDTSDSALSAALALGKRFSARVDVLHVEPDAAAAVPIVGEGMSGAAVEQIIASERRGRSYVPVAFWYFSLIGGLMLFAYALKLRDPVFVFGQGLGCFIYLRNLILIHKLRQDVSGRVAERRQRGAIPTPTPDDEKI